MTTEIKSILCNSILPRILWPIMIYDITMTTMIAMEKKISWYLRRWLGLPQSLNSIALYGTTNNRQIPLEELTEVEGFVYLYLVWRCFPLDCSEHKSASLGNHFLCLKGKHFLGSCLFFSLEWDYLETHLIGCSAGATFYKVPWRFLWFFFFAAVRFLTTSWWLINTSWVTLVLVYDVKRPKTTNDLGKNITDNVVRCNC